MYTHIYTHIYIQMGTYVHIYIYIYIYIYITSESLSLGLLTSGRRPAATNHAAKGSVFVNLTSPGNLKNCAGARRRRPRALIGGGGSLYLTYHTYLYICTYMGLITFRSLSEGLITSRHRPAATRAPSTRADAGLTPCRVVGPCSVPRDGMSCPI